jgi:uncharacterized damage-inducible protein DinB
MSTDHQPRPAPVLATELDTYREHLERYHTTTLQVLDALGGDDDLTWRPTPESYSVGQQLLHIAQTEDYYARGLLAHDWDTQRLRLDGAAMETAGSRAALRAYFQDVRAHTNRLLDRLPESALDIVQSDVPMAVVPCPLRWWLWFLLEHELLHKGQLAVYLRLMGRVAPYYAMPLPIGERPDISVRAALGGV